MDVPKVGAQPAGGRAGSSGCLPLSSPGSGAIIGTLLERGAMRAAGHSDQGTDSGEDHARASLGLCPSPACVWPGKISLLLL